jgi:hypothetical protein
MPGHLESDQRFRPSAADGAWGLRFPTLVGPSGPLINSPVSWPSVAVDVRVQPNPAAHREWGPKCARHPLAGGHHIEIRREPLAVDLALARPTLPECVIAPHLTSAASTIALWMGRPAIHGGAFLHKGGAWVLLGDKERGKSTTLGWLASAGMPIVTDDLVVCDGDTVLAGPRCVDLRAEPARRLNAGRELGVVGTRERWRIDVPDCPPSVPLLGWIFLEWGPEIATRRLSAVERVSRLAGHRAIAVPWDPGTLLDLASRPAFAWSRPRAWRNIEPSIARLLAQIAGE